jgi:maleate isomerase
VTNVPDPGRRDHPYRIGLIVPSSNTTMETELPLLLGRRESDGHHGSVSFHSSRIRMRHVTPEELRAMNAQTHRAAGELADAGVDVVATACLVAIMSEGPGAHIVAERAISEALREEGSLAPVVSSAGALVEAIRAVGAEKVALITPYKRPLTEAVSAYLADVGIQTCDSISLEVAENRAVAQLDPYDLRQYWRTLQLDGADALVLSACVQMRSLEVIDEIEQTVGLPVLSAATATAWAILRALGLPPVAPRAGSLLSGATADAARV